MLAAIGFVRPAFFLALFLVTRPLLDGMGEEEAHLAGLPGMNLAGLIGILLIAVAVAALRAQRRIFSPAGIRPFVWVLVVSALAALLALVQQHHVVGSQPVAEVVRLLALVAIYLLAANLSRTVESARTIVLAIALSGTLPALVAVYQQIHGTPLASDLSVGRVAGTFSGPNALGEFLALILVLLVFLPSDRLDPRIRIAVVVLVLVALVETYSRAGWIMTLLASFLLGWRHHKRGLAAAVALCFVMALAVPSVRHRALGSDSIGKTHSVIPASYEWRITTWRILLGKYEERPLTGFGVRTTQYLNPRQLANPGQPVSGYDAHNSAVKLLFEGGPLLLAVWVVLGVAILRALRRLTHADWELRSEARIARALWISLIVVGLTSDDPLQATALLFALLALTGALLGAFDGGRSTDSVVERRLLASGRDNPRTASAIAKGLETA